HELHALLCNNRLQDYIIILNVSHYAYTSSILRTAASVAITVPYFITSYALTVLVLAVLTPSIFLAESSAFVLPSSSTTSAFATSRFFSMLAKFFVLISSNAILSTTMNF